MKTVRLTMAQALVRFLENQYIEVDGEQSRFVRGVFIIPGPVSYTHLTLPTNREWWAWARR